MASLCCCLFSQRSPTHEVEQTVNTPLFTRGLAVQTDQPVASKVDTVNKAHLASLKSLIQFHGGAHIVLVGGEGGKTKCPSYTVFKHEASAFRQADRFKVVTKSAPKSHTENGFNGELSILVRDDGRVQIYSQLNLFTDSGACQRTCKELSVLTEGSFSQIPASSDTLTYSLTLKSPAHLFSAPPDFMVHQIIWNEPKSADFVEVEF